MARAGTRDHVAAGHRPHVARAGADAGDETNLEPVRLIAESVAVSRMGALMLGSGTGSFRVRQSMRRVAAAIGIDRLQAQITLSEIVSTTTRQGIFRTQVVEVPTPAVNAERIASLEALSLSLPKGSTVEELDRRLDDIEQRGALYRRWQLVLASAVACMAFAFLNNSTWLECGSVFLATAFARWVHLVLDRNRINQLAVVLVAAALASGAYVAVVAILRGTGAGAAELHSSAFTSSMLFLVPGFPLMTSALDLARLDFPSGIQRLTHACLVICSAGLGAWMLVALVGLTPSTSPAPAMNTPTLTILRLTAGFLGVAGFAIGFNTPFRLVVAAAGIGAAANTARLALVDGHLALQFAAIVATLGVGLAASVASRHLHCPRIVLSVPAVVIMVPGTLAFRALVFMNESRLTAALANGVQAALVVVSLAVGLALARVLTDREWTLD